MSTRRLVLAAALAAVACLDAACGRGGGGGVEIRLPAGATASAPLRAEPVADLAPLRAYDDGESVVAAARFEPSGTVLPEGTTVSWPLAIPRAPGERLYVVSLDEAAKRWLDTGDVATVLPGGRKAEGVVRHFSTIGLAAKKPGGGGGGDGATDGKESEEGGRSGRAPTTSIGNVVHLMRGKATVVAQAKMDAVQKIYDAWKKGAGKGARMDRATMREIYAAGDFATVKAVIENGGIEAGHSLDMADLRSAMILELTSELAHAKGWKVVRSDSGNQSSGMKSDVDQTVFVYEPDGKGGWKRSEAGDLELVKAFREQFQARTGFSLESLDVATIAGRDKFPDPRRTSVQLEAEGLRAFTAHAAETMVALRLTPGAYTYCGAVVQQMQLRADAVIEAMLRGEGKAPKLPREAHPELAKHLGANGVNNLVCHEIGPDEKGVWRVTEVSKEGARAVMFDSLPPKLQAGHAYDAAVANYLEFMHHLSDHHPAVKYMLRALDDGLRTAHRFRTGETLAEYGSVPAGERRAHLEKLLGHDPAMKAKLDRWKTAFDVSAALRDAHKGGNLTEADYAKALRPLAEEIAKERGGTPESHLARARKEYDTRCQEFLVANAIETASQRVMEFATFDASDPSKRPRIVTEADEAKIRESLGLDAPEKAASWDRVKSEVFRNEADLARLQLLYSFREMEPDVRAEIVKRAEAKGLSAGEAAKIHALVAESKQWYFGVKRYLEYPTLHHEYAKAVGRLAVRTTVERLHEALLVQSGWLDTDAGVVRNPKIQKFFDTTPLGKVDAGLRGFFAKNRAAGITSRYIRGVLFDPGNYAGVVQVVRAYCESGGDPDATAEAMVREAISILPGVGQVYTLAQSETVGQAVLTGGVMVTCILVPQAGIAALAFNLGEAGFAIYEAEFARPLTDTVADALYRGWVGPPVRSYDRAPAEFTEEDAKALVSANAGVYEWGGGTDPSAQRRYLDYANQSRLLRVKRAAWQSYDTERRRKPAWEKMGITSQRGLACPTLLDAVTPVVFYGPPDAAGPVDFTVKPLSDADEDRRKALEKRLEDVEVDGVEWQDAIAEYGRLETQRRAAKRAADYLAAARNSREMMHQIRIDSLWPWIAKEAPDRTMVDARAFAASWCKENRAAVVAELKLQHVLGQGADDLPEAGVEELGTRLLDDLTRSRDLWKLHRLVEEAQAKAEADRVERRKGAWYGEALAEAARRSVAVLSDGARGALSAMGLVPDEAASLGPLAYAIGERNVPEASVDVEVSLRKVPRAKDAKDAAGGAGAGSVPGMGGPGARDGSGAMEGEEGAKGDEKAPEYDLRPDVKITADPKVFRPPYRAAAFQLGPDAARSAASSGSFQGLPLDAEAKKAIEEHLKKVGNVDANAQHVDPLVLVFAFCDGYEKPKRIVPETLAALPDLPKVRIPGQDVEAYLLAGAAVAPPPEPIPEGDVSIRPTKHRGGAPMVIVTSQAIGKLDPAHPDVGIRFTLYRAKSQEGPFEAVSRNFGAELFPAHVEGRRLKSMGTDSYWKELGDDETILWDTTGSENGEGGAAWYQVGQVAIVGREKPVEKGEEVRSKPLGPGTPIVVGYGAARGDTLVTTSIGLDGWAYFRVAAGYADQQAEAWGAEIVIRDKGGERHAWTARREDGVQVGGDVWRWTSSAAVHALVGGEGGTVTATTPGGGTGTLEIPASAWSVKARDEERARIESSASANEASRVAAEKAAREKLAQPSYVKDAPDDSTPEGLMNWAWSYQSAVDDRIRARRTLEYEKPHERIEERRRLARLKLDLAGALAAARAGVDVAKKLEAIETDRAAGYLKTQSALDGISTPPKGREETVKNMREAVASSQTVPSSWTRGVERQAWIVVAEAAWDSADAGAFREALDAALRLADAPEEKRERVSVLAKLVDDYVALTADRKRGAALRLEREALENEGRNEKDRADAARYFREQLPGWWPIGEVPKAAK